MNLEARNLTAFYGKRPILHGIDLVARAGEITMIVGPNGSGKTTLMRALTGELPYQGDIWLNGHTLSTLKPALLARMRGVLAQDSSLAFPFTVAEIVGLGVTRDASRPLTRTQVAIRIHDALARVDLAGFAGRYYQELSGGERQRVQLARVLCQIWHPMGDAGPNWLFLDEPVSSLDIRHQLTIMEIARDYARAGGGVISIMHDLNLTAMYGDQVILVSDGRIVAAGSPEQTISNALLSEVYGCRLVVNEVPAETRFVLPQSAAAG